LKHHNVDGAPKTPYKPRKPKPGRSATLHQGGGDEMQSQLIIGGESPQEVQISQAGMSEQDMATANLIYEYSTSGDQMTIGPARVVIQQMSDYDGQTVEMVEQPKEEGEEGEEGETHQVVIHSYEAGEDGQATVTFGNYTNVLHAA